RAAADRLERGDQVERSDLRRTGDRAARKRRGEDLREGGAVAQPAFDRRDEVRDAGELALDEELGPADRPGLAHSREVVTLEVDDHHVLGDVLRIVHVVPGRPRALDRARHEPAPPAREEELRRRRDDRPAVAGERARLQRPEWGKCGGEALGRPLERRGEVLDEVDLVRVAARDRTANGPDRGRVPLVVPRSLPLAQVTTCYLLRFGSRRPYAAGEQGQRARLRRRR